MGFFFSLGIQRNHRPVSMAFIPFRNQRKAGNKVLKKFVDGKRYVMVVAYPQGGKTGTLQYVIRCMFENNMIDQVVVMCGSSEVELRTQFMADTAAANPVQYTEGKIHILMRQDMDKLGQYVLSNDIRTLVVWDESHLVQTVGQTLDVSFRKYGIPVNGDIEELNRRNMYILSVSATGFSELCDIENKKSHVKEIVYLKPGKGYRGTKYYLNHGCIHPTFHLSNVEQLNNVVNNHGIGCYNILRLTSKNEQALFERYCTLHHYNVKYFTSKKTDIAIEDLRNPPQNTTFIVVDGRLRVGKVIPKKYIGFVWECAKNPKTDTLLQGLLGRVGGYPYMENEDGGNDGYDVTKNIHIYVSEKVLVKDEDDVNAKNDLERYIEHMTQIKNISRYGYGSYEDLLGFEENAQVNEHPRTITVLPHKGMNLVTKPTTTDKVSCGVTQRTFHTTHTLRLDTLFPQAADDDEYDELTTLLHDIRNGEATAEELKGVVTDFLITNYEIIDVHLRIRETQRTEINGFIENMVAHRANPHEAAHMIGTRDLNTNSWKEHKGKFEDSCNNKKPIHLGSLTSSDQELKRAYVFYDTRALKAYLVFCTEEENLPVEKRLNVDTTGREVFCRTYIGTETTPSGCTRQLPEIIAVSPTTLETCIKEEVDEFLKYIHGEKLVRIEPMITFPMGFHLEKHPYQYRNPRQNKIVNMIAALETYYRDENIKFEVKYRRSGETFFNIDNIAWKKI